MRKQFRIRAFTPSGAALGDLDGATFSAFTKELNGGLGECVVTLNRVPNSAYDPVVQEGNAVEISVYDADVAASGETARLIYAGYVSLIEYEVDGGGSNTRLHILGWHTALAMDLYRSGTTTTMSWGSAYVTHIVKDAIDLYRTNALVPRVSYLLGDTLIDNEGPLVDYKFEAKSVRDVVERCRQLSDQGHVWYVGEDARLRFRVPPSSPTHKFVYGRHFTKVRVERSLEKVRTQVLVWNGGAGVYKKYTDAAAQAKYGTRLETVVDYGLTSVASADRLAARFLADCSQPEARVVVTILDNSAAKVVRPYYPSDREQAFGYDVESVNPGDTCRFVGAVDDGLDVFRDNMLITKVTYAYDRIELEIQPRAAGLLDWQQRTANQVAETSIRATPASHT